LYCWFLGNCTGCFIKGFDFNFFSTFSTFGKGGAKKVGKGGAKKVGKGGAKKVGKGGAKKVGKGGAKTLWERLERWKRWKTVISF
jgi:hypothetical protein